MLQATLIDMSVAAHDQYVCFNLISMDATTTNQYGYYDPNQCAQVPKGWKAPATLDQKLLLL